MALRPSAAHGKGMGHWRVRSKSKTKEREPERRQRVTTGVEPDSRQRLTTGVELEIGRCQVETPLPRPGECPPARASCAGSRTPRGLKTSTHMERQTGRKPARARVAHVASKASLVLADRRSVLDDSSDP